MWEAGGAHESSQKLHLLVHRSLRTPLVNAHVHSGQDVASPVDFCRQAPVRVLPAREGVFGLALRARAATELSGCGIRRVACSIGGIGSTWRWLRRRRRRRPSGPSPIAARRAASFPRSSCAKASPTLCTTAQTNSSSPRLSPTIGDRLSQLVAACRTCDARTHNPCRGVRGPAARERRNARTIRVPSGVKATVWGVSSRAVPYSHVASTSSMVSNSRHHRSGR